MPATAGGRKAAKASLWWGWEPTVNSRNAWIDHKIINSDIDHFANGNPSKCYEQTTNSGEEVSHIDQIRSLIAENADLYGKRVGPISKRLESIRHVQKHVKWGPPLKQVPVSYDDWQRHFWERGGSIPLSPETPQNEMVPRTRSKTGSPIAACGKNNKAVSRLHDFAYFRKWRLLLTSIRKEIEGRV